MNIIYIYFHLYISILSDSPNYATKHAVGIENMILVIQKSNQIRCELTHIQLNERKIFQKEIRNLFTFSQIHEESSRLGKFWEIINFEIEYSS